MAKYDQCILCGYHANLRTYHPEYKVCSKCESEILDDGIVLDIPERKIFMTWYQIKPRSEKRDILYNISLEDVKDLYKEANGRCTVSGIPFNLRHRDSTSKFPFMPAIDRIDPTAGYTKENCRIISNIVNYAKETWSTSIFDYIFNNYSELLLMNNEKETIKRLNSALRYRVYVLKQSTTKRGIQYNLSTSYLRNLLLENDYRCAITHIPFNTFNPDRTDTHRLPFMPAVMRRDPSKGFTVGNVAMVCQFVSSAKFGFSEDIFKVLFGYIEEYNKPLWYKIRDVVEAWYI